MRLSATNLLSQRVCRALHDGAVEAAVAVLVAQTGRRVVVYRRHGVDTDPETLISSKVAGVAAGRGISLSAMLAASRVFFEVTGETPESHSLDEDVACAMARSAVGLIADGVRDIETTGAAMTPLWGDGGVVLVALTDGLCPLQSKAVNSRVWDWSIRLDWSVVPQWAMDGDLSAMPKRAA